MKNEPNLKDWAEALIHGITGSEEYNPKLVKWVEAELNDIADKFYQMGFEDGDKNGWWKEQDLRQPSQLKEVNTVITNSTTKWKTNLPGLGDLT